MTMAYLQHAAATNGNATARLATVGWLTRQTPTHAATVAYNSTVTIERVQRDLDKFHGMLDRRLFGPRFNLIEAERRTWWAAFVEHLSSNTHAHLLIQVVPDKASKFEALWSGDRNAIWSLLAPAGSSVLKPLADRENIARWAVYATKEPGHLDHMILSRSLGSA